jgi:hypothetical protein
MPGVSLELPPLESLGTHSDFRPFLSPEVSPDLRRQALRRLFHLPEFNVRDGLTDYWEDYTRFEPLGDLLPHEMRAALEREARRLAEAAVDTGSGSPGRQAPGDGGVAAAGGEPVPAGAVAPGVPWAAQPERSGPTVGSADAGGPQDPASAEARGG